MLPEYGKMVGLVEELLAARCGGSTTLKVYLWPSLQFPLEVVLCNVKNVVSHVIEIESNVKIGKNAAVQRDVLYIRQARQLKLKLAVMDMLKVPKTFYSLHSVARLMKIPKSTIDGAFTGGIETIEAIKPIAHLFHRFEEGEEVSYGILKSHFDKWQRTGKAPKVSSGRPPKWKGNPNIVNINIPFPKNLYEEFKMVVDKANSLSRVHVTYRDMIAVAVQEFIERRPNLK